MSRILLRREVSKQVYAPSSMMFGLKVRRRGAILIFTTTSELGNETPDMKTGYLMALYRHICAVNGNKMILTMLLYSCCVVVVVVVVWR